jgi:hypothetical protein
VHFEPAAGDGKYEARTVFGRRKGQNAWIASEFCRRCLVVADLVESERVMQKAIYVCEPLLLEIRHSSNFSFPSAPAGSSHTNSSAKIGLVSVIARLFEMGRELVGNHFYEFCSAARYYGQLAHGALHSLRDIGLGSLGRPLL